MIEVEKKTYVTITAKEFLDGIKDVDDVCEVISAVAEKFDKDFVGRNITTQAMADNLSENSCRFLAEVITWHYARMKR